MTDNVDNLIEASTALPQETQNQEDITTEYLGSNDNDELKNEAEETKQSINEAVQQLEQQEPEHFNDESEQIEELKKNEAFNEQHREQFNNEYDNEKSEAITETVNEAEVESMINNVENQYATESIQSNYVPFENNQENEEHTFETANQIDDNEETKNVPQEPSHLMESAHTDFTPTQDSVEDAESEENAFDDHLLNNNFYTQDEVSNLGHEHEEFKESESISDILNNLMKEDVTIKPEYTEESNFHGMDESDVGDLLAEDTNISEESVMSQHMPTHDSTDAPIDPEDKLITFYPDMQEIQPMQQQFITSHHEQQAPAVEQEASGDMKISQKPSAQYGQEESVEQEASGDMQVPQYGHEEASGEEPQVQDNEIEKTEEHRTLSPMDLPFDTSVDYEPQQFEAENLVVETTTILPNNAKVEENNEQAETTTSSAGVIEELTTQTMLNLASRVTLMEPAAPVATTLRPLMFANDEVTVAPPSFDVPIVESLLTTKPTTGNENYFL